MWSVRRKTLRLNVFIDVEDFLIENFYWNVSNSTFWIGKGLSELFVASDNQNFERTQTLKFRVWTSWIGRHFFALYTLKLRASDVLAKWNAICNTFERLKESKVQETLLGTSYEEQWSGEEQDPLFLLLKKIRPASSRGIRGCLLKVQSPNAIRNSNKETKLLSMVAQLNSLKLTVSLENNMHHEIQTKPLSWCTFWVFLAFEDPRYFRLERIFRKNHFDLRLSFCI